MKAQIFPAFGETWPPVSEVTEGPWVFREGGGGGKRVSATTATRAVTEDEIRAAEARMLTQADQPLFMIGPQDAELDEQLARLGYDIFDRTLVMAAAMDELDSEAPPPITAFAIWPPLQVMRDIWEEGDIDAARQAVMQRVEAPKTSVLGRTQDKCAGAAFVAIAEKTAMVHAVYVKQCLQRQGTARNMMREARRWAQDNGATSLSALVTEANAPARALYSSLELRVVGKYHYRQKIRQ